MTFRIFLCKTILYSINTICWLFSRKPIVINSCIIQIAGRLYHNNWGDDINYYVLKQLTASNVVNYRQTLLNGVTNYLCIGSIIEALCNKDSIIWGSGAMYGDKTLKSKPKQVLAVRGPLTRQFLLSQGVDCPEVYGDPALLLPIVYKSNVNKKHKIGIIPHRSELNLPIIELLRNEGFKLIDLRAYNNWTDIIDEINECDAVLSSSLHGLIVSDAYGIPNKWVRFVSANRNNFKYEDYFASVNRYEECMMINGINDIYVAQELVGNWSPIAIDLSGLIASCPFKLQKCYDSRRPV